MGKRFERSTYIVDVDQYKHREFVQKRLQLLNWNIQKKNYHSSWTKDFETIVDRDQPDVILLQECKFKHGLEEFLNMEGYGFVFAPNFVDRLKNMHSGVLSASFVKHKSVTAVHSHPHEPFIRVPKIFLQTEYDLKGREDTLLILNIHAINFVGVWKFFSQLQQLEFAIINHKGPVILSGDFNTWNKRRVNILLSMVERAGMKQVDFHEQEKKKIKKFLFRHTLDHIFFRDMTVAGESYVMEYKSSDHNPMMVEFDLD